MFWHIAGLAPFPFHARIGLYVAAQLPRTLDQIASFLCTKHNVVRMHYTYGYGIMKPFKLEQSQGQKLCKLAQIKLPVQSCTVKVVAGVKKNFKRIAF